LEINANKPIPQERAAHAAAIDENEVMMIYGGSTKNGGLAEDEIWLLYLNEGKEGEDTSDDDVDDSARLVMKSRRTQKVNLKPPPINNEDLLLFLRGAFDGINDTL